jgi:hypothetical protein
VTAVLGPKQATPGATRELPPETRFVDRGLWTTREGVVAERGPYAKAIISALRGSPFGDVALQIEQEIAAGKASYVRQRRAGKKSVMLSTTFEEVSEAEVLTQDKPRIDVRVLEYSSKEADQLSKAALQRQFVEPIKLVQPLLNTLGALAPEAIRFADPDSPEVSVGLDDYVKALESKEVVELRSALEEDE